MEQLSEIFVASAFQIAMVVSIVFCLYLVVLSLAAFMRGLSGPRALLAEQHPNDPHGSLWYHLSLIVWTTCGVALVTGGFHLWDTMTMIGSIAGAGMFWLLHELIIGLVTRNRTANEQQTQRLGNR